MSYTVVIPSKSASNLSYSANAVCSREPDAKIIVVDDGIDWQKTGGGFDCAEFNVIDGKKPFIFARNCNLGIKICPDDVVLLNDDALLQTPHGFSLLEVASRAHPEFGLISAVTNVAGNPSQRPRDIGLREERRTVAFVCVYIPRKTIELVGLLDERFTEYGWEDNDYCRRVREAGLKIGIFDFCYVDHSSLRSSFRGFPRMSRNISAGRQIYMQKWGSAL